MKFPFVRRRKAEESVLAEKERRAEISKRAKEAASQAAKKKQALQSRIQELEKQLAQITDAIGEAQHNAVAQIEGHHDLRPLFAHKLRGEGIEIGALHRPLPVPPGVKVRYVDKRTRAENRARYPELDAFEIVETDYICDGQTLSSVPDASQDFVIANHMLEHCVNPLHTLENFLRVLKLGGRLYISLPDKRFTFDYQRQITPWAHVLEDYRTGREVEDRAVYEEFRDLVEPDLDVEKAIASRHDIHHHVWTQVEILELFLEARRTLGWTLEIELFGKQGNEVILVMQKIEPVHEDHSKLAAASEPPEQPVALPTLATAKRQERFAHEPISWSMPDAHVQIEETTSSDTHVAFRGFVLVKSGRPEDVKFDCQGLPPEHIQWFDRPDVYAEKTFASFPRHVRCGFILSFRKRAWHPLAITFPQSGNTSQRRNLFSPATGFAPIAPMEQPGTSLAQFAARVNEECRSVLEIGSRIVSPGSVSKRSLFGPHVKYTGFDIYSDANTDVVGDAHRLSTYFAPDEKFDAVFSLAVFEHLAMPWLAALEVSKVLKIGGLAYHLVPFSWPLHETPWDFWRCSHEGLRMLFSPALGFEVLDLGLTAPCRIHFEEPNADLIHPPFSRAYGEANILVRKVRDFPEADFRWNTSMEEVLPSQSAYPQLGQR